jgi:hypothetical protein
MNDQNKTNIKHENEKDWIGVIAKMRERERERINE